MRTVLGSVILPGDSDAATWRYGIMKDYSVNSLNANILLAAHHGSLTFFSDPAHPRAYFKEHLKAITPEMVFISVGENAYGHPDPDSLRMYSEIATGSNKGNKVKTTQMAGSMELKLTDNRGWSVTYER